MASTRARAVSDTESSSRTDPQPIDLLLSALQEPTLLTDPSGRINHHNAAASEFFGADASLVGVRIQTLLPFIPLRARAGSDARRWEGEVSRSDGPHLVVEVSRSVIARHGTPTQHVYVVHDISRLTELNWWREQLLYQFAHEIRGALGIVATTLRWSALRADATSSRESVEMQRLGTQAIERSERLIEDLLSAGSIRSGRLQVHPQPTSVEDLICDALAAVEPNLQVWNQRMDLQVAPAVPLVMADRSAASRVLINLLSNASKYSPKDEVIALRVEQLTAQDLWIAVEDHGPGIAKDEQAWIFERFYRVRGTGTGGIGLGLAIAKGIVEAHGGTIGLESEPGAGTQVWFTLPVFSQQPEANTRDPQRSALARGYRQRMTASPPRRQPRQRQSTTSDR